MRLAVIGIVALAALSGCKRLAEVGSDTVVTCRSERDCPGGMVCDLRRQCVKASALDTTPPDLAAPVAVSPERVRAGQSFTVTLATTEPLSTAPMVSLGLVPTVDLDCDGAGTTWTCHRAATGEENAGLGGVIGVDVRLEDLAGNGTFRSNVAGVAFDFAAPSPTAGSVAYVPGATNPLSAVARATAGTVVRVAVSADEPLSQLPEDRPALVGRHGATQLEFAIAEGGFGASDVVFEATVPDLAPDGAYTLAVTWSDTVGNRGTAPVPGASVLVRTTPPSLVVDHDALVFVRSPQGNDADEDLDGYVIPKGPYFAVEPSDVFTTSTTLPAAALLLRDGSLPARVVVQSTADDRALVLGVLSPDASGRFPRQKLVSPDLLGVWLVGIDDAGNPSAPVKLRDAEWVATPALGAFGSPHALWSVRDVAPTRTQPLAVTAPGRGQAGGRDGLGAVARSAVAWEERTPVSSAVSPIRERSGVAYDSARGRLVLFGGRRPDRNRTEMSDTWEWDATAGWRLVTDEGPPAQMYPTLTYDAARARVVLVDASAGQTWEWDGAAWMLASSTAPAEGSLVYDARRERVVLLRGSTWEWDGAAWTTVSTTGPVGASAFDESTGRVAVYDGTSLWAWDGQVWTSTAAPGPAPGFMPQMAYDRSRGRLTLPGLWSWNGSTWDSSPTTGATGYGNTFLFNAALGVLMWAGPGDPVVLSGDRWLPLGLSPSARMHHAMSYDAVRGRVVLFGGANASHTLGDTWEWDGTTWTSVSSTGPSARTGHVMAFDATVGRTVLAGGVSSSQDTWEWDGATWTTASPVPAPRSEFGMAFDAGRGRLVAHGGLRKEIFPDTWERSGRTWSVRSSAGPSVYREVLAYDATYHRTVMFGGLHTYNLIGDGCTWIWDGSTWERPTCDGPFGREYHAMAYDEGIRRVVLFGGYQMEDTFSTDDVWEWDGASWTTVERLDGAGRRFGHQMVYDTLRHRLVVFGGADDGRREHGDTWERDSSPTRQPALQFEASRVAFGIDRSRLKRLEVRGYAGGAYAPGRAVDSGAALAGWASPGVGNAPGAWTPLASNTATLASPTGLLSWRSSSAADARRYLNDLYGFTFQVRPGGTAGSTRDGAAVALDYLEVRARYAVP